MSDVNIKALAAYLPQFHPIKENDLWWGKGFTEWRNVAKAQPLFENHWQPRFPADLGYYDLRVPEVREAQANLARQYGLHGFLYWHYWFGGKRILERPFNDVVESGKPNFPFCLAWANQTWKGTWHGLSNNHTLIEQTYPGVQDYTNHFYSLLEGFQDPRYIEVNGKKLFFIFKPLEIPDTKQFISTWQELATKEGLHGFHFAAMHMSSDWSSHEYGYDAFVQNWSALEQLDKINPEKNAVDRFFELIRKKIKMEGREAVRSVSYSDFVSGFLKSKPSPNEYPLICADWDNTPRSGRDGWLFSDFSLDLFEKVCSHALASTANKRENEKIVIIKSWNEWAEGNYLEPDTKYGHGYLQAFKNALINFEKSSD